MFNKVIMVGNLTRDVELRYLPSGSALATIGLASNRRFKKQDGSIADESCFIDVKLFGRTAEVANQYLRKGSKVLIEGRLTYETWTDQMGAKKSRHTITAESMSMLDNKSSNVADSYEAPSQSTQPYAPNNNYQNPQMGNAIPQQKDYVSNIPEINIDEDEIPF
ncbi:MULTISPECIES: single-stranded DNA-binding protein [unclassified Helicobacter]|uniref:single-stranded DNA-binding protein n=1 Tax=unclassified Helicobacter TaxID=2593540 RepID=UPI000CF152AF|nr:MULTISPECIES: single-stranded DNA-binding protein [unclassified Helicobacter]